MFPSFLRAHVFHQVQNKAEDGRCLRRGVQVFAGEAKKGGHSVGTMCRSFARRRRGSRSSSKKFSRKAICTAPFSSTGAFELGNIAERLPSVSQVVVQSSAERLKLLIGPHARLAGDERLGLRLIARHHDAGPPVFRGVGFHSLAVAVHLRD